MADCLSQNAVARFLNPWTLHLQKLGLELKCPLCLDLLKKPILLPCNHIFCQSCVPKSTKSVSECPVCKDQYVDIEMRPLHFVENIVSIFRSLEATCSANVSQRLSSDAGSGRLSVRSRLSDSCTAGKGNGLSKRSGENSMLNSAENNDGGAIILNCQNQRINSLNSASKESLNNAMTESEELDMNQVPQSSPGSPPSFGNVKDMDSGNPGCRSSKTEDYTKKSLESGSDMARDEYCDGNVDDDTFPGRDIKRQKKLTYTETDFLHGNAKQEAANSDTMAVSNYNLEPKTKEHLSYVQSAATSVSQGGNGTVCAFCQTSKITDGSGPMLHYADGRELVGDIPTPSNAIPVHSKCIDWTPKVYYEGDTIKNLESELARAAKLKCTSCGKKGAALGCFVKSCRKSYHVPCAFDIQECRWDCEDFLLLCPSHSSVKFPREKCLSRKKAKEEKHPLATEMTSSESKFWSTSWRGADEWVICGSALSAEDKYLMVKFAGMCGATVTKFWKPNVTHVIAATDSMGACSRTLKVLLAILNGRWILTIDWIKACMEANRPLNEEPYEVRVDKHGCCNGPRTGRLRASNNDPKLFEGLKFYFSGDFVPAYKADLLKLVMTAGGSILENEEHLMAESDDVLMTTGACLVVYNRDPLMFGEDESIIMQRLAVAEDLACRVGCQVIRHTWILETIAACKLLPFLY